MLAIRRKIAVFAHSGAGMPCTLSAIAGGLAKLLRIKPGRRYLKIAAFRSPVVACVWTRALARLARVAMLSQKYSPLFCE